MAIYGIADLHLSFLNPKPMDIFGNEWKNHEQKIKDDWENKVKSEDTVILPGDFSWAMTLEEARQDFTYLNELPGKKIMLKGNHDYWWESSAKMQEYLQTNNFDSINFLHNNSYEVENKIITRDEGLDVS